MHWLARTIGCAWIALLPGMTMVAQGTEEFIVISIYGDVRVYVLPVDWKPSFTDPLMSFADQGTMPTERIAAIKPRNKDATTDGHEVMLSFRTSTGKNVQHRFWLPDQFGTVEQAPVQHQFHRLDAQTFVRQGAFTLE